MQTVQKNSWKTIPMTNPKRLETEIEIAQAEYDILKMGYIPESMDVKWFV